MKGTSVIQHLPHISECSLISSPWLIQIALVLHPPPLLYLTSVRVGQTSKWKTREWEKKIWVLTQSQQLLHFHFPQPFSYLTSDLLLQQSKQSVFFPGALSMGPLGKKDARTHPPLLEQVPAGTFLLQLCCSPPASSCCPPARGSDSKGSTAGKRSS